MTITHALRRAGVGLGAVFLWAGATGCSAEPADTPGNGSASEETAAEAPPGAAPPAREDAERGSQEEELRTLFREFWSALVALENGERPDPGLLDGIVTDEVAEEEVSRVEPARAGGHTREGAPEIGEATVEVDGDEALIQACVDPEGWLLLRHGEPVDLDQRPSPSVVAATRTAEGWLISATGLHQRATLSC